MSKNEYRSFFAGVCPYLKMSKFLKLCHISPVNFSRFMKGSDWNYEMSAEKLMLLKKTITDFCENIA